MGTWSSKTDRFLAFQLVEVPPINNTKHPAHVMMLGVVWSDGKRMKPLLFPSGTRVGTKEYLEAMENHAKLWPEAPYPDGMHVWQQDGDPSHTAKVMQNWLSKNLLGQF